jgi:hypothetical protein
MTKCIYLLLFTSWLAVMTNPKNIPAIILMLLSGLMLLADAIGDILKIIGRGEKNAKG